MCLPTVNLPRDAYKVTMTSLSEMRGRLGQLLNEGGGPWGGRGSGSGGGSDGNGSGGGGSGGPRNPWNQPPEGDKPRGPGGKGPSALDELLRRAKGVRGQMPGGGGSDAIGRWAAYGIAALIGLWIVLTSTHFVQPAERGVVTRMGKYSHTLNPGMSFTLPAPFDAVTTIDVDNIRTISIPEGAGERLVLTGDQNIIDVEYQVRWKIRNPELFLFQSVDTEGTIKNVADSALRATMANVSLNDAIGSGRAGIEQEVATRMQALLENYRTGVVIQGVTIKAAPPEKVVDAFNKVSAAQQAALTSVNQARAYASQVTNQAQGGAAAFDAVYAQYKLAPEVTRRRMYYETMEQVLSKVDKTVVEVPGIAPYLPLPAVKRSPDAVPTVEVRP